VLRDSLSSSIDLILISSSMSYVAFLEPVNIDGSSEVRSMFSAIGSIYSDLYTGGAMAASYETVMRRFSGGDGA
jgi:hypothetical protein